MRLKLFFLLVTLLVPSVQALSQPTRLLRQPSISSGRIAFTYGSDVWVSNLEGEKITRLTSTPAVESNPCFSPDGKRIAFTSNRSGIDQVYIVPAEGGEPVRLTWYPSPATVRGWTPDGKFIAFTDDDVRIRLVNVEKGDIQTIDTGGTNLERGSLGLTWSPDSKWLAYAKTGANNFRNIMIWSDSDKIIRPVSNPFADAFSPSWDTDSTHLYFLAGTDLALGSGWANTSSIVADPQYTPYVVNLKKEADSPFKLKSDEEKVTPPKEETKSKTEVKSAANEDKPKNPGEKKSEKDSTAAIAKSPKTMTIDFEGIDRRILPLPLPARKYGFIKAGPKGTAFIGEQVPNSPGMKIHKFTLEKREAKEYVTGAFQVSLSSDRNKMLARIGSDRKIMDADKASGTRKSGH